METFFKIRYEFSKNEIHKSIEKIITRKKKGYICVADGNVLTHVQADRKYWDIIYNSIFSICDSSWIPIYLKLLYGITRKQYSGPQIFKDLISEGKYRMAFLGTNETTLQKLKAEILKWNKGTNNILFKSLPYCNVSEFDYKSIAEEINLQSIDIIWISLGAPKQEIFMHNLLPFLTSGIMLGVGAAFNFYSGQTRRAPEIFTKIKIEFLWRIILEPKKQTSRCINIIRSLPYILRNELNRKRSVHKIKNLVAKEFDFFRRNKFKTIIANGQSPDELDALLDFCRKGKDIHYTIFSDDARLWNIPPNVNIIPDISNKKTVK